MIPEFLPDSVLVCLRDFFASQGQADMRRALEPLCGPGAHTAALENAGFCLGSTASGWHECNWCKLEYQFNRLFVGPDTVVAPPYASFYLEAQPRLFGETTLQVRTFYAKHGFLVPGNNSVPDDFLPYELDAALALRHLLRQSLDERVQASYTWFVCEHMGAWLPPFGQRVRTVSDQLEAPIYLSLALLELWQDREAALCALFR